MSAQRCHILLSLNGYYWSKNVSACWCWKDIRSFSRSPFSPLKDFGHQCRNAWRLCHTTHDFPTRTHLPPTLAYLLCSPSLIQYGLFYLIYSLISTRSANAHLFRLPEILGRAALRIENALPPSDPPLVGLHLFVWLHDHETSKFTILSLRFQMYVVNPPL